jgi:hypothetical protein
MWFVTARRPRLHFVWMGRLPYYARLAIESAATAMPDADITLHVHGGVNRNIHVERLERSTSVEIHEICVPELFEQCAAGADAYVRLIRRLTSPAAISNLLRLAILHRDGGVYLDTDVLVIRPVHDPADHGSFVGREWVWDQNRRRVAGELTTRDRMDVAPWAADWALRRLDSRLAHGAWGIASRPPDPRRARLQVNNAVIGSAPGSRFVAGALDAALDVDPTVRFALGPTLLDDVARARPRDVQLLPPSRFYAVPPAHSFRCFEDEHLELPCDSQILHVVASNHRRLLDRLDESDPRFERSSAPYWRHARAVRAAGHQRRVRTTVAVESR